LLLAVDEWAWERHWWLLMEVGGGWGQRERGQRERWWEAVVSMVVVTWEGAATAVYLDNHTIVSVSDLVM
jgi:hypothetical protein